MSSELVIDMKLALASIGEIINEKSNDKSILDSCQLVMSEVKKAIKSYGGDVKKQTNLEITELFGLFRTRITLMLLRDVNRFGENDSKVEESITIVLNLIEEKISRLKEGKEKSR